MTTTIRAAHAAPYPADNVAAVSELRAWGLPKTTIAKRCRPGGPWRRLAPGVVLLHDGEPTRRQLLRGAVTYLRPDGVVTGVDALNAYGLELISPRRVHVLVPTHRRVQPPPFVLLERTSRPPDPVFVGGVPLAPPTRATLDAARRQHHPDVLRALLTLSIYHGLCTLDQLRAELDAGNQRGSAPVRKQLELLNRTRDTYMHGVARQLLTRSPLPPPRWNTTICDLRGRPLGTVDAWWDEIAMGWQFSSPLDADGTHLAHLSLVAAGVVLVRSSPEAVRADGDAVLRELARAFRTAACRTRPRVRCEPLEAAA